MAETWERLAARVSLLEAIEAQRLAAEWPPNDPGYQNKLFDALMALTCPNESLTPAPQEMIDAVDAIVGAASDVVAARPKTKTR